MKLVNMLSQYMGVLLGTLIAFLVVVGAVVFYLIRVKKLATEEEHINYDRFERKDSTEFVKFKDIISSGGEGDKDALGMIAIGNNTFVSGIDVVGYNFHSASADERLRTMQSTIAFFNIVENPIQMRQTVRAIDIRQNIQDEEECARNIERDLMVLTSEYESAVNALEECVDNDDLYNSIEAYVKKLMHTIRSKQWQLKEAKEMIYYMETVSDASVNMRKVNQILFSYIYNPDEDIEQMSEAEIYLKAERELLTQAQIYGGALENCGCSWNVLSADDLTDLLRRHYHPDTADDMTLKDILNSSYSSLYISTDSLEELERERRGDLAYEQQMEDLERQRNEAIKAAERKKESMMEEMKLAAAAVEGV